MAKRERQLVSDCKTLEALLLGRPFTSDGNELSAPDQRRVANALCLWLLVLHEIAEGFGLNRVYSFTNLRRSADRLAGCDVSAAISELDALLQQLRLYQPHMGESTLRSFKEWMIVAYDQTGSRITFDVVWPLLTGYWRNQSPSGFRDLNTVLQFWKRLTLEDVTWVEESTIDSYVDLELRMKEWVYDSSLTDELQEVVTDWMSDWTPWGAVPQHSNGATAEVRRGGGKALKYEQCSDTMATAALAAAMGYGNPLVKYRSNQCELIAQYALVPKGVNKKRGISFEPTVHQYYQQGIFRSLQKHFWKHPEMKICLEDQELSRHMCLAGSRNLRYCTVDLSEASDTVTWRLVRRIFQHTKLLSALWQCRTEKVRLPDGRVMVMEKYAPMGSALCFPIECIVFAAICFVACRHAGCRPDFRVYGDDIIIPVEAFAEVLRLLEALHFRVNMDKTFGPYSLFLEACGMEAFCGYDVSPCRLPRRWDIVKLRKGESPEKLTGAIELANRLYAFGFNLARRYVVSEIRSAFKAVPFSVDPERGIYHPDPGNDHLISHWDTDTQQVLYWTADCGTSTADGPDDIRYQMALEAMSYSMRDGLKDPLDLITIRSGKTQSTIKYAWMPKRLYH